LIEKYPCSSRDELVARERYYTHEIDCINIVRNQGIEKELGIEPPDLEGIWNENLRIQKEQEEEYIRQQNEFKIVYHYIPQSESIKPTDENVQ
jgi:hypothetical protein